MTEAYKYEMVVYWSSEDGAFVVEVRELPGCMADGPTPPRLVARTGSAFAYQPMRGDAKRRVSATTPATSQSSRPNSNSVPSPRALSVSEGSYDCVVGNEVRQDDVSSEVYPDNCSGNPKTANSDGVTKLVITRIPRSSSSTT